MNIRGYQTIRELSRGGFGAVHLAVRNVDGREVAVKVLHLPSDDNVRRFYREAKVLHRELANPHVVDLVEADFGHSPPFIVMEFCSGGSLQRWVSERRDWDDVVVALAHAAEGLRGIHSQGGFHRDIKPGNLLLALPSADRGMVKVGDFGLARVPLASSGPMTRSPWGTDGYIAPEVLVTGTHSAAADVYSLGITGIELLTGQREPAALAGASGPKALHAFLVSMVHTDPARRPTMGACASRFDKPFADPLPMPIARPVVPAPRTAAAPRPAGGAGALVGLAAMFLGALAIGAAATSNTKDANGRFHGSDGTFRSGRWS